LSIEFQRREIGANSQFNMVELEDGSRRKMTEEELDNPQRIPPGFITRHFFQGMESKLTSFSLWGIHLSRDS
jgi:hypothetical protein